MFAVDGETLTETDAGVDGFAGVFDVEEVDVPAQPQVSRAASKGMALAAERMALRAHLERVKLGLFSDGSQGQRYWTKGKKKGRDQSGNSRMPGPVNPLSRETSIAV